ncbi:MaoC family dehydratase [Halorussus sp. AFM4]|uniref:MaoC family dehydratase n=1 Tax=Halorussus sp. AFM4 TaxID=3421651 RepID=UPI003EB97D87
MPVATVDDTAEASLAVTRETIDAYADLTGDDNPIHLDDGYAAETLFGGRVAHGMLSAGVVSAALADLPGDVIYLSQDLDFENPVRPGQTITATATVTEDLGDDRLRVETVATAERTDASERAEGDDDAERVLSGEAVVLSVPHEST